MLGRGTDRKAGFARDKRRLDFVETAA